MDKLISSQARIGRNTVLGLGSIIMDDVVIGNDCCIGNYVVIYPGTQIADNVRIDDFCVIGKKPLRSPRSIFSDEENLKPACIRECCLIGTGVIIYAQAEIGRDNLIADFATIRENVEIGDFNIIGRNVTIENYVRIGDRNKFETNCYITAYSQVEDYCFIAPCVATSNDNYLGRDKERFKHFRGITIRRGGRIGVNATVLPGKTIEPDGVVAGGSTVTRDVSAEDVWMGSPARKKGKVPVTQLLINNLDKK
ncbi:MAG: N-acetyltransferase [Candidatus Cloacimonetes bacterium]|nr:N-acetyltransferase [Candidatus Cloacimonadota bacterium]